MDESFANTLEAVDGLLTGVAIPPIVNAKYKEAKLREIADSMGINLRQTLAVGDGANDLKMLNAAGIGVAFRAKPVVRTQARYQISTVVWTEPSTFWVIGPANSGPRSPICVSLRYDRAITDAVRFGPNAQFFYQRI